MLPTPSPVADRRSSKLMVYGVDKNMSTYDIIKLMVRAIERETSSPKLFGKIVANPDLNESCLTFSDASDPSPSAPPLLSIYRAQKPPNKSWFNCTLLSDSDAALFTSILQGKYGKESWSETFDIKVKNDPNPKPNPNSASEDANPASEPEPEGPPPPPATPDEIRTTLTPFWSKPYADQLTLKEIQMKRQCALKLTKDCRAAFDKRIRELKKSGGGGKKRKKGDDDTANANAAPPLVMPQWVQKPSKETTSAKFSSPGNSTDVAAIIKRIVPSPVQAHYRNKCEFTFGQTSTLRNGCGFKASGWQGGVSSPIHCLNVPPEMVAVCEAVNNVVGRESAPKEIGAYKPGVHSGVWRQCTVRFSERTGQCMVVLLHAPHVGGIGNNTIDEKLWQAEKQLLVTALQSIDFIVATTSIESRRSPDYASVLEAVTLSHDEQQKIRMEKKLARNEKWAPTPVNNQQVTQRSIEEGSNPTVKVTSIFFQEFSGMSIPPPEAPVQLAFGNPWMEEVSERTSGHVYSHPHPLLNQLTQYF